MSLSALVQPEADAAQQPSGATARLLLSSVDRPGITAAVSSFLEQAGANICEAAQYSTDPQGRGELPCEMSLVVSNHTDLAEDVDAFDVSYEHIPVTPDTKPQAEERLLEVLGGQY